AHRSHRARGQAILSAWSAGGRGDEGRRPAVRGDAAATGWHATDVHAGARCGRCDRVPGHGQPRAEADSDQGLMRLLIVDRRLLMAAALVSAVSAGAQQRAQEPTRIAAIHTDTLRPEILGTRGIVAAGRHYSVSAGVRIMQ